MQAAHKKWVVFGSFLVILGSGTLFLWKATSRSEAPTGPTAAKQAPAGAENLDHELKMLGSELEKKPGHTPVLMRMAQIERTQGKLEDAEGRLREVVKNEPSNPDALLELGRLLYEKGDVTGAIAETQKALDANPRHVDALYNLGAIYANTGDPIRARSYWTKAVEAAPETDSGKKAREGLARIGGKG
jgi:cytochrome c-type biogenesis protein CcmH/NrfG